ncbi:MAG TPA: protein kinase [Edaphobacter sp.]|nr:protein kinase [Edaphobacter sp.]
MSPSTVPPSTMSSSTWIRVSDLVDAAMQLSPEERAGYLDKACDDPKLRAYIDSLVVPFEQAGDFLEEPALESYARSNAEEYGANAWIGRRIGDYRLDEQIGEGGMGAVFRASRADDQYRKQVAIKLLKEGFESSYALARFRAERQILANLEHPNIARLIDGGQTEEGFPYFVMELVDGEPIDQYCDAHKLSINERLRLFSTICSAVEYAHQNLVIHRDLKPANILVTADGAPKLLDFGIARLLSPDLLAEESERTVSLLRVMTPEYASPEQIRGDAVTTASDVYSLGVVLYLLLTGHRPYYFTGRSPTAMAEVICDTEPLRPSVVVSRTEVRTNSDGSTAVLASPESVSAAREDKPERLRRRLSGDLDNVLLMALRKEPQRRYASVGEFSRDIQHYLQDAPVLACQDTFVYRTSKFIRRHRVVSASVAIFTLTLLGGILTTLHQARIARAERAKAERRFNDVRQLANAMMFDVHDSIKDLPGATSARKLLVDRALQYLDSLSREVTDDPSLEKELATAYEKVGDVQGLAPFANLGDTAGALASYNKALEIRQSLVRAKPGDTEAQNALSSLYYRMAFSLDAKSDFAGASASIRKALAINEAAAARHKDATSLDRLAGTHYVLAGILTETGALDEAMSHYKQAEAIRGEVQNPTPKEAALLRGHLVADHVGMSEVYELKGELGPAVDVAEKALSDLQQLIRDDPKNATMQMFVGEAEMNLGKLLEHDGRLNEAQNHLGQAEERFRFLAGADPSDALVATNLGYTEMHLGETLVAKRQIKAGLARFATALEGFERTAKQSRQSDDISFGLAETFTGIGAAHAALAKGPASTQVSECRLAVSFYDKSLNILSEMQRRGALVAQDQSVFHQTLDGRAACQKVLASRLVNWGAAVTG